MSSTDRWWALDLVLVVVLADLAGAAIYLGAPGPVRVVSALLLVLVLPGYALTAVFFPAANGHVDELASLEDREGGLLNPLPADYEVDGVERVVLSMALSIAVVPAVAAVASFTPAGVSLEPILFGVVGLTVALSILAFLRRLRLPPESRFGVPLAAVAAVLRPFPAQSPLYADSGRSGTYNTIAAVGLLLVLASVGFALVAPPTAAGFTEFHVVTDDATGSEASPYPSSYATGETTPVPLGIENHENREVRYTIVVALQDPANDGSVGTADDGGSAADVEEIGRQEVTVGDGEASQVSVDVTPTRSGEELRLLFLLYRGDPPADPSTGSAYRVLDLSVDVTGSGAAA